MCLSMFWRLWIAFYISYQFAEPHAKVGEISASTSRMGRGIWPVNVHQCMHLSRLAIRRFRKQC